MSDFVVEIVKSSRIAAAAGNNPASVRWYAAQAPALTSAAKKVSGRDFERRHATVNQATTGEGLARFDRLDQLAFVAHRFTQQGRDAADGIRRMGVRARNFRKTERARNL